MELRVLGPLELVEGGQRRPLGGPKQRTVLAVVIANAGRSVSFDHIIEATWGDEPPDGARASVHTYISKLRSEIGDVIERLGDGYVLRVEGDAIDAVRFENLFRRASEMLEDEPESAAAMLREALDLWRGYPYADIDARGALEPEIARLNELRVSALLARLDADLALGNHSGLIGELDSLSAEHPLQEGFRARQMLALYRSGRQADALRVYDRARRYLGEELGIDPSRELQRLEQQILDQDSALDLQVRPAIRHVAVLVADVGDPETLSRLDSTSRADLLERVEEAVESSVEGAGGAVFSVRGSAQYASFENAADAISAAGLTHRALDGFEQLPRVAVDVGDVETQPNGDFTGPAVARAAALVAAAHAGQVLISSDAHDELTSSDSGGWQVRALGSHRLWGFDRARPIYQLLIEGREQSFPPLEVDAMPPALPGAGRGLFGYELRDLVGTGTFGEIYRAYQPSVGREVAIKVLKPRFANEPEFIRRFEVEAQLVARLEHPHIVPLYDYWREPDRAYLVMRWLRGGSVADRLADGPVSPEATSRIISQVGGALVAAHRQGVVHRDLKPSNVMLDDEGNAYLTDFGIAQSLTNPDDLSALAAAYQPAEYVSPEERSGEPVTPATDVFAMGVLSYHLLAGQPPPDVGAIQSEASLPSPVTDVIQRATAQEPTRRFAEAGQFTAALRTALGTPSEAEPTYTPTRNPYKGLAAFTESDAADFHGRDEVVDEILGEMANSRLVAVVGPSGIGKSSVVRAGVVPRLRSGAVPGSSGWFITEMVPSAYPFEELATALMRVATASTANLDDDLRRDRRGMLRAVTRLLPPGAELVIVIDQFEELFTLADPESRDAFLDALTVLVTEDRSPARVVLTIRADYFDQPLRHAELGAILRSTTVPVGTPTVDELHQIVEKPAIGLGVAFEPGLSEHIVAEVAGQPGALPLLEYALTDLFDARELDVITAAEFADSGGVLAALGKRADATFEALGRSGREAARQIFLRLVSVDESLRPARRRARRAELRQLPVLRRDLEAALVAFGEVRLLTFDRDATTRGPTVEVAHEALFSDWERLAGWIEQQREDLLMARRLAAVTEDWESVDRAEEYLLSRGGLAQHEAWTADTELNLTNSERDLLAASRVREDDRQRKRRRRRIGVLSGFGVAAVVALVLAAFALAARNDAVQVARTATARALASAAAASVDADPERSLLLALAAADTTHAHDEPIIVEAVEEVHRALLAHRVIARYPGGAGVAISPDGSLIAIGRGRQVRPGVMEGTGLDLVDVESGAVIGVFAEGGSCCREGMGFGPDNRTMWMKDSSTSVLQVWDAIENTLLAEIEDWSGPGGFNPDGSLLVVQDPAGKTLLWDWKGDQVRTLLFNGVVAASDFSPDGQLVALANGDDGTIDIFDVGSGTRVSTMEGTHEAPLSDVEFSPDGASLVSSSDVPALVLVSSVDTGETVLAIPALLDSVEFATWSPDGGELLLAGGEIAIVNAADGSERLRITGIDGLVLLPNWFPDGSRIAASARGKETLVWDVQVDSVFPGGAWHNRNHSAIVVQDYLQGWSLRDINTGTIIASRAPADARMQWPGLPPISADRTEVAMFQSSGVMTFYDTDSLEPLRSFRGLPYGSFSPDGTTIPVVFEAPGPPNELTLARGLADARTGEVLFTFDEVDAPAAAAFHPSGDYVVATWPTRMYDTGSGEMVFAGDEGGTAIGFSPDGSLFAVVDNNGFVHLYDFDRAVTGATFEEARIRGWQALSDFGAVVRWTPDGSRLLVGGFVEDLIVYDREGENVLFRLPLGSVASIDFTEDAKTALVSTDTGLHVIPFDIDELLAVARSRLTRGFTAEECVEFFPDGGCPTFEELRAG